MPSLRARGLRKAYGDCVSLDDASLTLTPGRVHALVGENGAGKSTLIRCLCGLVAADAGSVTVDESELPPGDVRAALGAGIGVVHQHFMLAEALTVAENVVLGAEPRRGPFGWLLDRDAMDARVRSLAEARGMPVDPSATVASLGVGERQRVEILKVLHRGATVVLLDEPTAVLSPAEVTELLAAIRAMAAQGAAVLLVTHKLDEVFAVADEITVLRRGKVALTTEVAATSHEAVVAAVVGDAQHTVSGKAGEAAEGAAGEALSVRGVRGGGAGPFTLTLRAGEVLGVAGVEGNGQRALLEMLSGMRACEAGTITLGSEDVTKETVAGRRARGVGFVPEDREGHGLFAELTVAENLALGEVATATLGRPLRRGGGEGGREGGDRALRRAADGPGRGAVLAVGGQPAEGADGERAANGDAAAAGGAAHERGRPAGGGGDPRGAAGAESEGRGGGAGVVGARRAASAQRPGDGAATGRGRGRGARERGDGRDAGSVDGRGVSGVFAAPAIVVRLADVIAEFG
ncbi:MAG: ATP-binding cassette domain-containing protein [Deltaproteobacteria bacterium]|nr:ATP-binding cassette domain-containing protein [Deltaproteobacteria bacterium]